MNLNLPNDLKPVEASGGSVTTNTLVTGQYVNLSNALRAWLLITLTQAVGFAEVISLTQAQAVAGTGVKAGPTSKIWANEATGTNDTSVRQTDGASYTTNNTGSVVKQIVIEVDPAAFDAANGYQTAGFTASASSQATNFISATWLIQERYPQATPPSAVVN